MAPPPSPVEIPKPEGEAGLLLWDKPAGITSHDVVEEVRRETGVKVGHAGTLDPFATGLLIILLGRATRLQRYFLELPKRYEATARLGWTSSTGDPDGELTETGMIPADLEIPCGSIDQQVPMTSAVKVGGERLYRKAHRGEVLERRPSRQVTVHEAELLEVVRGQDDRPESARYALTVSSGTYVRNLVSDLGDAFCSELRRTAIGKLTLDRAGSLVELNEALDFMPAHELHERQVALVRNGVGPEAPEELTEGEAVRLVSAGDLLAIGRVSDRLVRPEVVIRPAQG